jgi:hypothetical protein
MKNKSASKQIDKRGKLRRALEKDPRVVRAREVERQRIVRQKALENDEQFVLMKANLERELVKAYSSHSAEISSFFHRFSLPSAFGMRNVKDELKNIADVNLRRLLEDYIIFSNRFRVQFMLNGNPPSIKALVLGPPGKKFHVKVVGAHLEPIRKQPLPDEPYSDFFEAENFAVLPEIQELIDRGDATFVQIEDSGDYSLLKDLESFAYKDDGVAFLFHRAEQPYLLCLFGEKANKQLLARAGKGISAFQREFFRRAQGGRPRNMEKLKNAMELETKSGSTKAKAIDLTNDVSKSKAAEVYLAKLRSKLRRN